MWIKAEDTVEVTVGVDRGTRGKVLRVLLTDGKAVVEGVNRAYKHVRRSQRNPQGGRLSMEMPISLSNMLLVCQACGAAPRWWFITMAASRDQVLAAAAAASINTDATQTAA